MTVDNTTQEIKNEAIDEVQNKINTIQREETLNIKLTSVLNETTRIAGELRLNAETLAIDEELKQVLVQGSESLKAFNKGLTKFLSK